MGSGLERFRAATRDLRRVAVDTNLCLYLMDPEVGAAHYLAREVFAAAAAGAFEIDLAGIVRLELMVRPLKSRSFSEVMAMRKFGERYPGVIARDVPEEVLLTAAEIRAMTRLKTPDALVVGSAIANRCDGIIGNDKQFRGLNTVQNVRFITAPQIKKMPRYIHIDDYMEDA